MTGKLQTHFIDLPDVRETFVDSLGVTTFDGTQVRLELHVTRLDPPGASKQPSARRYPAARIVMTPQCAMELCNQLNQFVQIMKSRSKPEAKDTEKAAPAPDKKKSN